ncbi:MAG: RNA polymerase subunit sigma-70 [Opitutae bacterium]|nr:RNA polymerase subunit sigma-70 [Opitutae bacterium]
MSESAAHAAIETVARQSYGRLVAYLAARSGDIAGAEDALSEAFGAALRRWPADGVPEKPEAWLLHAARNRLIDAARHTQVRRKSEPLLQLATEAEAVASAQPAFPDERLKLLFVCAHPAIDPAARTPLMLQAVLGLDAARIASAFLVSPAAMGQRLVRAKTKVRDAAIPFRVPDPPEWDERVSFVLAAIYAAYTAGWETTIDDSSTHHALAGDAIAIGRTLVQLLPVDPEARGLLALMLHCEARRAARHDRAGAFVPLDRQEPALWSWPMIDEAEEHLRTAAALRRMGRYQLEAAIQSLHAHRAATGVIDWPQIALLYEGLVRLAPTIGAQVGRAVALAESGDAPAGLAALDALPASRAANYQPWWAARAHLLRRLDRSAEARAAAERAASLTDDPALRAYLLGPAAQ